MEAQILSCHLKSRTGLWDIWLELEDANQLFACRVTHFCFACRRDPAAGRVRGQRVLGAADAARGQEAHAAADGSAVGGGLARAGLRS